MITEFKIYEGYYPEYEVGDISIFTPLIVLEKNVRENKTQYYKIFNILLLETNYKDPHEMKNFITIENAYNKLSEVVEIAYKRMYNNWEKFDMSTANQVKNVMDIWLQKIPELKIFSEIDKYNL